MAGIINILKGPVKLNWKKGLVLAGGVLLGLCLILLGGTGNNKNKQENITQYGPGQAVQSGTAASSKMTAEEDAMASRLQLILEGIEGAGRVKVTVKLAASARELYAVNATTGKKTTVEKDQSGGIRTIDESNDASQLVVARNDQGELPVVEMESSAKLAGVLVVAEGAKKPEIKAQLFEAVQVALGIEPQKVLILPGEGGSGQ